MATRADLERENAELRSRLARYEGKHAAPGPVSFGMSEGVRADIENAKALMASDDPTRPEDVTVHDTGTGTTYKIARDGGDVVVQEFKNGDLEALADTRPGRTDALPGE